MQEIFDFLKNAGIYYIATADGDQPHLRPFTSLNLYQGRLYIQTGKVKKVAQQMKANPKVELCAMGKGGWIRVTAQVTLDESAEAQQSMFDANPGLDRMYAVNDGNNEVYFLHDGSADIFRNGQEPEHYEF